MLNTIFSRYFLFTGALDKFRMLNILPMYYNFTDKVDYKVVHDILYINRNAASNEPQDHVVEYMTPKNNNNPQVSETQAQQEKEKEGKGSGNSGNSSSIITLPTYFLFIILYSLTHSLTRFTQS